MKNRAGAAFVELVILIPILVLIVIGVAEFGRLLRTSMTLSHAVKAGAQYGAQNSAFANQPTQIANVVRADASPLTLDSVSSSMFCRCPDGSAPVCSGTCPGYGAPEVFVRVRARKAYSFLLKYPGLPGSVPVVDTAVMRIQ